MAGPAADGHWSGFRPLSGDESGWLVYFIDMFTQIKLRCEFEYDLYDFILTEFGVPGGKNCCYMRKGELSILV